MFTFLTKVIITSNSKLHSKHVLFCWPLSRQRVTMAAIEIFSSSANYKYKTKICSLSFFVVLFFITLSLLTPLFIIYNAGGRYTKNICSILFFLFLLFILHFLCIMKQYREIYDTLIFRLQFEKSCVYRSIRCTVRL